MKRILVLFFTVMLLLPSTILLADDAQNASDQNASDQNAESTPPNAPSLPTNVPAAPPVLLQQGCLPLPMPEMTSRTVVATSDGGIAIVNGNKITKLDRDLNITQSVTLPDTDNTGNTTILETLVTLVLPIKK